MNVSDSTTRPYRMGARAEHVAETRARIIDATVSLLMARWADDISLRDVAAQADVALQTVVRHFGTRDALFRAVSRELQGRAERQRFGAPVGDVRGAVANIVELMEEAGPRVLRALAQEDRVPGLREAMDRGRATHRRWVETVFGPLLPDRGELRRTRVAQLASITDVYTWKLLRQDHGLSRRRTEDALVEIIEQLLDQKEDT